jgi:hypothetical protein
MSTSATSNEARKPHPDRERPEFDESASEEARDALSFTEKNLDALFEAAQDKKNKNEKHAAAQMEIVGERSQTTLDMVDESARADLEAETKKTQNKIQERAKEADKKAADVLLGIEDINEDDMEQMFADITLSGEIDELGDEDIEFIEDAESEGSEEEVVELSEEDIEVVESVDKLQEFLPDIGERISMTADEQLELIEETSNKLIESSSGDRNDPGSKIGMALSAQIFALNKEKRDFKENKEKMEQKLFQMQYLEGQMRAVLSEGAGEEERQRLEEVWQEIQQLKNGEIQGVRLIDSLSVDSAQELADNLRLSFENTKESSSDVDRLSRTVESQFQHLSRAMTARIEDSETPAFIKPSYGDMPGQGLTIEAGTGPMREWLAFQVSEMFGDLGVPPTACRFEEDLDGFVSAQKGVPGELAENFGTDWQNQVSNKETIARIGVGDYLNFNNDGGRNNIQVDGENAYSIDNARSFSNLEGENIGNSEILRSDALDAVAGERVPDDVLNKMRDFLGNEKKQEVLKQCFEVAIPRNADKVFKQFVGRVEDLVNDPTLKSSKEINARYQ